METWVLAAGNNVKNRSNVVANTKVLSLRIIASVMSSATLNKYVYTPRPHFGFGVSG
jgi:hypothetical protein